MDLVRSAAWSMGAPARADDVDPDELFWNPAVISDENCPEINGKFRVPPLHYDVGFFSANVPDVKKVGKKIVPIELCSRSKAPDGIKTRAQSEVGDLTDQRTFGKRFGCANGGICGEGRSAYTGGGDTFTCTAISYSEVHWKLDENRNLVVNRIQRNPCWLHRGSRDPLRESVLPVRIKHVAMRRWIEALRICKSSMKRRHYLLLVASQMIAACTPMDLVRSAAWSMGASAGSRRC